MQLGRQYVHGEQYSEMSWCIAASNQTSQAATGDNFVASGHDENQTVIGNEEPDWLAAMVNSAVGPAAQPESEFPQSSDFEYHEMFWANSSL